MGSEISDYLKATDETVKVAYSGWPVFARASQVRAAEEAWSVEVGVAAVEMYPDGYNNRAKLRCQALVRYVAKAPTHDSLPQALDIATSLGAFLNHATMAMEDPDAPGNRVAVGEIVRDVRVFTEAETVMRGGVRVPTGGVQVILQWEDELTVTPDIVIQGYTVTSPNRPPAQPDTGGDPDVVIESVRLQMPADRSIVIDPLQELQGLLAQPWPWDQRTREAVEQQMVYIDCLLSQELFDDLALLVYGDSLGPQGELPPPNVRQPQAITTIITKVNQEFDKLDAYYTVTEAAP